MKYIDKNKTTQTNFPQFGHIFGPTCRSWVPIGSKYVKRIHKNHKKQPKINQPPKLSHSMPYADHIV